MFGAIVIVVFVSYWLYLHIHDGVMSINESEKCKNNREPYHLDHIGDSYFTRLVSTAECGFCQFECGETVFYTNEGWQYRNPYQDRRMLEYTRLKKNPSVTQSYYMVDRWGNDFERGAHNIAGIAPNIPNKGVRLFPLKEKLPVAVIVDFGSKIYAPEELHKRKYYMNPDTRELLFPVEGQNVSPEEDAEIKKFWLLYLKKEEKEIYEKNHIKCNAANLYVIEDWKQIEDIYKENNLNWFDGHDQDDYKKVAI